MRKAIIAIARDENRYLDEWIRYYSRIGFDSIFLWDNNDPADHSVYSVTNKYPYVKVLDVRGREKLIEHGMQTGCYQETYDSIKDSYDWIGLFDIDEFLYTVRPLDEILNKPIFSDTGIIHLNWRYYGDNGLVYYDMRPVQERFPEPCPDNVQYNPGLVTENVHVKSIIRGKCDGMQILNPHTAWHNKLKCRHICGRRDDPESPYHAPVDFSVGYVKHYGTKTISEYINRRCKNEQNAAYDVTMPAETRLEWFFNVNARTLEKERIVEQFLKNVSY